MGTPPLLKKKPGPDQHQWTVATVPQISLQPTRNDSRLLRGGRASVFVRCVLPEKNGGPPAEDTPPSSYERYADLIADDIERSLERFDVDSFRDERGGGGHPKKKVHRTDVSDPVRQRVFNENISASNRIVRRDRRRTRPLRTRRVGHPTQSEPIRPPFRCAGNSGRFRRPPPQQPANKRRKILLPTHRNVPVPFQHTNTAVPTQPPPRLTVTLCLRIVHQQKNRRRTILLSPKWRASKRNIGHRKYDPFRSLNSAPCPLRQTRSYMDDWTESSGRYAGLWGDR